MRKLAWHSGSLLQDFQSVAHCPATGNLLRLRLVALATGAIGE